MSGATEPTNAALDCECGHHVMHHVTTRHRRGCFPPEGCDCRDFRPVNDGRIDIGYEIQALCNKLGFPDKGVVYEIRFNPTEAIVLYHRLDESGHKHIEADGNPATRWLKFRVRS